MGGWDGRCESWLTVGLWIFGVWGLRLGFGVWSLRSGWLFKVF